MTKREISKNTSLFPVTVVLASCSYEGKDNIITLAWASKVCMEPPKMVIAINQVRHSYDMIKKSGEFVINIPNEDTLKETDLCGLVSGRDKDKFELCSFTKMGAKHVSVPLIKECPVNIECRVTESLLIGSHEIFVGEVLGVWADEEYHDGKNFDYDSLKPVAYVSPGYRAVGKSLEKAGFSKRSG